MKGYEVGQVFKVVNADYFDSSVKEGDLLQLETKRGEFRVISGDGFGMIQLDSSFDEVERVWPPGNDKVLITCEGKTVEISRESAKALNLI